MQVAAQQINPISRLGEQRAQPDEQGSADRIERGEVSPQQQDNGEGADKHLEPEEVGQRARWNRPQRETPHPGQPRSTGDGGCSSVLVGTHWLTSAPLPRRGTIIRTNSVGRTHNAIATWYS